MQHSDLRVHITGLRRALGDGQGGRRFIVNTPGRGYGFVAPISRPNGIAPAPQGNVQSAGVGNLPRTVYRMVGREHLVELLVAQLPQRRLITLTGSGGIGKTTVALAVANALRLAYRDGAYLIDFAPVAEAALVPSALSSALGLPVSSSMPIPSLVAVLHDKQMLLVFDNCEHVIDVAASLAHDLSRDAPDVHILTTSRQPLRVAGEHVQRLPPLDLPPAAPRITAAHASAFAAVRLFTERASALLDTFELSDGNAPLVALICRRLDGIALAIEFAAARVDALGLRGVADRLDDRFRLLKRGARTAHPRHQTLRATFDWSYDLLAEAARTVLRRLAVFAGQFTLDAAIAVVAEALDEADVADEFAALASASLVIVDIAAEPVSYRLLESTRAYALERLIESGERPQLSRRHAEHFLRVLGEAEATSLAWPNARWMQVHGPELDNVRVALDWAFSEEGDARLGVALTIAAVPLWQRLSLTEECRSRAEAALARLGGDGDRSLREEMKLHAALGSALALRSDADSAAAWTTALGLAERAGDAEYQLRALRGLWRVTYGVGNPKAAHGFARRFAEVAAASGATAMRPVSDHMTGMNSFYAGDLQPARLHIEQAMRAAGAAAGTSDVLRFSIEQAVVTSVNLSKILWLQGYPDQAVRVAERSIGFASSAGHGLSLAYALAYAACRIAIQTGDLPAAESYLRQLGDQVSWDPLGQWEVMYRCWNGVLLDRQGKPGEAIGLLADALRNVPEGSFRLHHTRFLGELARALGRNGRPAEALDAIDTAISVCNRLDERWFFPELLRFKGGIVLAAGGSGARDATEAHWRSSLDWGRSQGALSWELRTATDLARLKQDQGRTDEARDLLAPIYGRFTEGFGTGDLRTARVLLDELG